MIHQKRWCMVLASVASLGVVGCMPKFTVEELKNMRPERPAELDKLNMFAGQWESTSEMKLAVLDETMHGTGTGTAAWECDGWLMVERGEYETGELGTMDMLGVWAWDPKAKVYRNWWFNSYGEISTATARYEESTRTWRMKGKGRGPWGASVVKGTMKMVDDDNMEWTWTEWDGLGLTKTMEIKGTSKRK